MKKLKKEIKGILKSGVAVALLLTIMVKVGQLISWVLADSTRYFIGLGILVVILIITFKNAMDW